MVVHESLRELVTTFGEVARVDPLSALMLALGALFVGVASLVFGYLSLRGLLAAVSPPPGRGPPRQAE